MRHEIWLAALTDELRRHGIGPDLAGHVVAEAAAHLRDSGEPPLRAFGPPQAYAAAVADSVGGPATATAPARGRAAVGPVRLRAVDIVKRYGRRTVLSGVSLTLHAGQVAAVVGANGSGKSTFLRICAGLVGADRGHVELHGRVGYCPQAGGTADFLTAGEHFALIGTGRGLQRGEAARSGARQAAALDWTPGGEQARHLSGGTRQKLNLVLADLGDPDVLLLDEPYQGFDRGTYLDFWHEVWRWRDAGRAVVVVTHLLNQLDRVDVVLDLSAGRAGVAA
ncbi:ATP-binding cassette domain-containing protein [Asanoa sp. WMMD1127]|uniref:ATP-binding cassette domain-containing protein n=1 Tax=Asanoa sp. WMMD1127 TaxID=3016107 RepID=UPI0024172FE9|nr:ATP-binding cassette domain-containing protein [Asanoa sp. WMMD1127]MDG4822192.1 ATP-binding cassette domain-containing protein [Asanoa sp. WMMD1127]